jgi:hypothetical protein
VERRTGTRSENVRQSPCGTEHQGTLVDTERRKGRRKGVEALLTREDGHRVCVRITDIIQYHVIICKY